MPSLVHTLTYARSPLGLPVRCQIGRCVSANVAVDDDGTTDSEEVSAKVAGLGRYILTREDKVDDPLYRITLRVILEPDDGSTLLVTEPQRTPSLRQVDDLRLLVLEFLFEDAVQL